MNTINTNVCAIIVTYNRKELLLECLESIKKQSVLPRGIYIIDNASTDGTAELLLDNGFISELPPFQIDSPWEKEFLLPSNTTNSFIKLHYVRMHKNTGGAGGFYEGVKRSYMKGYDLLWLMDDDTIPTENALENMLKVLSKFHDLNVGFISSKVLWIDGTPHIMNVPGVKPIINGLPFNIYEDKGVLLVESASFVSLLINRKVVEKVGLPLKEFFIWADDVEYTLRITKKGFLGLLAKNSVVIHKTSKNYSAGTTYDKRFYYNIRNWLWIYKIHFRNKYFLHFLKNLLTTYRLPRKLWFHNIRACFDSLFKSPKIEFLD
jgi:GT2 family glycosyltransferase